MLDSLLWMPRVKIEIHRSLNVERMEVLAKKCGAINNFISGLWWRKFCVAPWAYPVACLPVYPFAHSNVIPRPQEHISFINARYPYSDASEALGSSCTIIKVY